MPTDKYGNYVTSEGGIGASVIPITARQWKNSDEAIDEAYYAAFVEMQKFKTFMQKYPGPKSPTTYDRTNDLRNGWYIRDQRGIAVDLYNIESYAKFVHGDNKGDGQQAQHIQTGWPNMFIEFQRRKKGIVESAQVALNKAVQAQGLHPEGV